MDYMNEEKKTECLNRLDGIIQKLSSGWNIHYIPKNVSWKHPIKKMVYKSLNFISDKICGSAYQRQREFNLNLLLAIQEFRYLLHEDDGAGTVFLCEDDLKKENNILDVLLVYQVFAQKKCPNAQLYLAPDHVCSEAYLQAILDEIEELGIKNIHFVLNQEEESRRKLREQADILISLKNYEREKLRDLDEILLRLEKA